MFSKGATDLNSAFIYDVLYFVGVWAMTVTLMVGVRPLGALWLVMAVLIMLRW